MNGYLLGFMVGVFSVSLFTLLCFILVNINVLSKNEDEIYERLEKLEVRD